jgi:hypothetical protein
MNDSGIVGWITVVPKCFPREPKQLLRRPHSGYDGRQGAGMWKNSRRFPSMPPARGDGGPNSHTPIVGSRRSAVITSWDMSQGWPLNIRVYPLVHETRANVWLLLGWKHLSAWQEFYLGLHGERQHMSPTPGFPQ